MAGREQQLTAVTERAWLLGASTSAFLLPPCSGTEIHEFESCLCLHSHYGGVHQPAAINGNCSFWRWEMSAPPGIPRKRKACGLVFCSMATSVATTNTQSDWPFIIFASTCCACLLTSMCWNAWTLVSEGFFLLFHLLMFGRAAVTPNSAGKSYSSVCFAPVPKSPCLPQNSCDYASNYAMTMQWLCKESFWPSKWWSLALPYSFTVNKKKIKWTVIFKLQKILQYF